MTNSSDRQRLFFALWPDESVREAVAGLFSGPLKTVRGRKLQLHNVHITLAFVGRIDAATRDCMQGAAGQVRGQAFELQLNQLGYWSRPKVVWLGSESVPPTAIDLQQGLVHELQACGFEPEKRPFHPHLTLMRKVHNGLSHTKIDNIAWSVSDFVLVRSNTLSTGVEYEVIARWPLIEN